MKRIAIEKIRRDGGTQPRSSVNSDTVDRYAEAMGSGAEFPPVVVFFDGSEYWLADGFHRVKAGEKCGQEKIASEVRQGTRRDAQLYSLGANDTHGLPRSNADKRRAVMVCLDDQEWSSKSDRWIAEKCAVGNKFVGDMRRQLCSEHSSEPKSRTGKDGKTRKEKKAKATGSESQKSERWTCPKCHTEQTVPLGSFCPNCYPAVAPSDPPPREDYDDSEPGDDAFDSHDAVHRLTVLFDEIMLAWPRTESLAPMVDWLKTKLGMTRQEAETWLKSA